MVASGAAENGPSLVFDPASGAVLAHDRAGDPWYPASLTKLMTAYVIFGKIRAGSLRLDQKIPVSRYAASQEPSKLGIPAGQTVSVDMALQALLVYSANDMAVVLAEAAGGDNVNHFVREMNMTAQSLRMSGSFFTNPNGLYDERQMVTARDLGLLAQAILAEYPEHAHYFSQPYVQIGKRKLPNRNLLLRQMKLADGMKTGYICNSGFNLVGSATQKGRKLVAVVLGAKTPQSRADTVEALLNAAFVAPPAAATGQLARLEEIPYGARMPVDLTQIQCKRPDIHLVRGADLDGWGVSFGRYPTADEANTILEANVLSGRKLITGGRTGIVSMEDGGGFEAVVWHLDPEDAQTLCRTFGKLGTSCTVLSLAETAQRASYALQKEQEAAARFAAAQAEKKKAQPKKATTKKPRKVSSKP